jgi:hypothetical protein
VAYLINHFNIYQKPPFFYRLKELNYLRSDSLYPRKRYQQIIEKRVRQLIIASLYVHCEFNYCKCLIISEEKSNQSPIQSLYLTTGDGPVKALAS